MTTKYTDSRSLSFLNESNYIESIVEIDYNCNHFQNPTEGHFGAFVLSQESAFKGERLTAKMMRKWHELITKEQLQFGHAIPAEAIGHFRSYSLPKNVLVGRHVPPDYSSVPTLISFLLEDITDFQKQFPTCDDVALCDFLGSVFQRFESIHPFVDGNGRTGRLLANFLLTWYKRPIMVFNSEMIERNRYYEAHKSKNSMKCFMAKKLTEAIFGVNGKLLQICSSTSPFEVEEGNDIYWQKCSKVYEEIGMNGEHKYTEVMEWHHLALAVQEWEKDE